MWLTRGYFSQTEELFPIGNNAAVAHSRQALTGPLQTPLHEWTFASVSTVPGRPPQTNLYELFAP